MELENFDFEFKHQDFTIEQHKKALEVLDFLEIPQIKDKKVHQMSTGQLRRCIIGRALIHEPKAFILENVKQLVGHDQGKTLKVIIQSLKNLGYYVQYSVLNALDYGLPQKRERVVIVGHREPVMFTFPSPKKPYKALTEILEHKVDEKYFASDYIKQKRKKDKLKQNQHLVVVLLKKLA